MKTEVIHITSAPAGWERTDQYVYIGRAGRGHQGQWGNPFTVQRHGGQQGAVLAFREWLDGTSHQEVEPPRRKWILKNLHLLKGKILVCFCKSRDPRKEVCCHGDVYADRVNRL